MGLKVSAAVVSFAVCSALGTMTVLAWAARQTLSPAYKKNYDIKPVTVTDDEIELLVNHRTTAPGIFGMDISGEDEPAVVGSVLHSSDATVWRRVLHRPAALTSESHCRWSGVTGAAPEPVFSDVTVPTSLGPSPAWIVDNGSDFWAVHVHGQGSRRRQTLRGVASATALGLNSIVISYRNDGDGPLSADGLSHLGESEWRDLEDSLRVIADRGAAGCIVFGWSLGATIAANTLLRSSLANMIKGVVMIAPVLSWEAALRANAEHKGLPQFLGSVVTSLLGSKKLSRLVGLESSLDVRTADTARLNTVFNVPILILHNRNDWSVPIDTSRRFADDLRQHVELVEFDCIGHTQEWNSDPVGWDLAVRHWYGKLFQPGLAEDKAETAASEHSNGVG